MPHPPAWPKNHATEWWRGEDVATRNRRRRDVCKDDPPLLLFNRPSLERGHQIHRLVCDIPKGQAGPTWSSPNGIRVMIGFDWTPASVDYPSR